VITIRKLASRLLGEDVVSSAPIVRGVALSYAYLLVSLIATILLTPVILRYIGQSAFGLWATFGSVVGYFGLLDFGMNSASVKYTAEYLAKSDKRALSGLVSTILFGVGIIGAIIIVISFGLMASIPRLFHLPSTLMSTGQAAFVIMGSNVALGLAASALNGVIYGFQRIDVIKTFGIIQTSVNACLTLLFLRWGFGLIGVVLATTAAVLTLLLLALSFMRKNRRGIAMHWQHVRISTLREIAPYSFRSFILGLTAQVLYRTDNIVIGIFLAVAAVTPYSIAYKLCFLGVIVMYKIGDTLFPTFTRLYTSRDMDGLRSLYVRTARIAMTIMVPFAFTLVLAGRQLINLWVGDKNFVGMSVLLVLVAMDFIHATAGPAGQVLQAIGKNKEFTYSAIADAALNLTLSIILCQHIGLLGVALGTLIAHVCTDTWVVIWLACKYIALPVRTYLTQGILLPVLSALPAAAIVWGLFRNPSGHGLFYGLSGAGLFTGMYLLTQFGIAFPPSVIANRAPEG
jgi:O-antigen/teichoic acid export membrane protein